MVARQGDQAFNSMMANIRLHVVDQELARAVEAGDGAFRSAYDAELGDCAEMARAVVAQTLSLFAAVPRPSPFGGFLASDTLTRHVVGTCGFKNGPDGHREVEIAYFTFPEFENRGYATAMARELVRIAIEAGVVEWVVAHTLPVSNASTRILQNLGFHHAGQAQDDEVGEVWKWQLAASRSNET
jgi:RimJ/RimL family protein N-acetyltransferase